MRTARLLVVLPLAAVAACGGATHTASPLPAEVSPSASPSAMPTDSATPTPTPTPMPSPSDVCQTSALSLKLGSGGGAAGSVYQPIVFTNKGATECTLAGYPGVAFVAPGTGAQVGAAASRNPQQPIATITLAPGASASSLLQIADYENYPLADCDAVVVSGVRVYPPGDTDAAYVPFSTASKACSTQVNQLTIQAVVTGSTGQ